MRSACLYAYRLPADPFERYARANGYWVAPDAVEPSTCV
jgi:hypothetical protein